MGLSQEPQTVLRIAASEKCQTDNCFLLCLFMALYLNELNCILLLVINHSVFVNLITTILINGQNNDLNK